MSGRSLLIFLVVAAVVLPFTVTSMNVTFKECTDFKAIQFVEVPTCSAEPCPMKKGSNQTLHVGFTAQFASNTSKVIVHGVLAGVPVPWPIPQNDGCKSGVKCPIVKGSKQLYTAVVYIDPKYPAISVAVKFELQAQNKQNLFCFLVPIVVVN